MTNDDGQDIIEETESEVYHKYYETENKKVETIGDKTKTTYTDVNDYSTVAFMDCNAAYFSVKK